MEELQNPISRRRMLKRVGAGAAIAWSAPILSSLRTPAFAQYPTRCTTCGGCGALEQCGVGAGGLLCFCVETEGSGCFCSNDFLCSEVPLCPGGTDSECPPGWACQVGPGAGCCGPNHCVPPCGIAAGAAAATGAKNSG